MNFFFRYRVIPCALLLGAQACTLTADDYSPGRLTAGETEDVPCEEGSCTGTTGTAMASEASTRADAGADASASAVTEAPPLGPLVGNEEGPGTGTGTGTGGLDAGTPAEDAGPPSAALPALIGWAGVAGLGLATTSGGGAAPAVLVQTAEELIELAARPEPLTLAIDGILEVGSLELASDKTLFGTNAGATLRGGIAIVGVAGSFVRNVIVHNLHIEAATSAVEGDGIQLSYAHHVWIDHCEIRGAADDLVSVIRGSDFVTVSSTRFLYTADAPSPVPRFASLVGHDSANVVEDQGHLNVTWHHNWWSDGVTRALLGRFGSIHLFNNLFGSPGNDNVLEAGQNAQLLVENNMFVGVAAAHVISPDSSAALAATGNVYIDAPGARDVGGTVFVPPYEYDLEPALAALGTNDVGPQ